MLTVTRDLVLPTTITGSYPRPLWFDRSLNGQSFKTAPHAALSVFSRDGELSAAVEREGGRIAISVRSSATRGELWRIALPASAREPDTIAFSERSGSARQLAVSWHEAGTEGKEASRAALWRLDDNAKPSPMRELARTGSAAGRHSKRIPSMTFHPTAQLIVTGGEDRKLALWDYSPAHPNLVWEEKEAHETTVHGVAFNADGTLLASGGGDYRVKVWRTADMLAAEDGSAPDRSHAEVKPILDLRGHADSVFAVAFSPDGRHLASGGYDRIIRIWNLTLKDGQGQAPTIATLAGHQGTIYTLNFSKDGRLLTSGANDGAVRVWDAAEGRVLVAVTRPGHEAVRSVSLVDFDDDLHIGGDSGWSLWSVRGRSVAASLRNGGATVGSIAFDPTGEWLAAGGNDGKVRVWRGKARTPAVVLDAPSDDPDRPESINGAVFSADGRWLAAAGEAKIVHVWDRQNGWRRIQPASATALRHEGAVWGLCFDPLGGWLASSNTDSNRRIRRWRTDDWSMLDQSEELVDQVYSLACATDGKRIVAGDSRARVTVRSTEDLRIVTETINVHKGEVNVWSVAIADQPRSVLSGNSDGRVYRWTPADPTWTGAAVEEKIRTSDEDARVNPTINSVSYSRRHGWVAAGGDGGSVELYDANLRRIHGLKADGNVWWVTFDAQGSRLAFGGIGRILRIFDLDELDRTLTTDTPDRIYRESQRLTGLSVDIGDGRISIRRR
jgi:WD40 repeat protein